MSLIPAQVPEPLPVAVSSALAGQFAPRTCGENDDPSPLVGLSAQFAATGSALRFDIGDFFGSSKMASFALSRDPPALAAAVRALGLQALSLGHRDLAAPRAELLAWAHALRDSGVTYTVSNLRCGEEGRALCDAVNDALDPPPLFEHPRGKVAFISALSPSALEHAAKDRTRGIVLESPSESLSRATQRARAAGATWVVAAYEPERGRELEDTIAMALGLLPEASPDVVFVPGIADKLRTAVSAVAETEIVAAKPAQVTLAMLHPHNDADVAKVELATPDPTIERFAAELNRDMCRRFASPLPGGKLTSPIGRDELAALVLDILRDHSYADIAVMNRLSFAKRAPYPMSGALDPMMLMQVLPFDNELRLTRMKGTQLKRFLEDPDLPLFYVRGAVAGDGGWQVNGRPLDPTGSYRVVTSDFVAEGAHGGLGPDLSFSAPRDGKSVRQIAHEWLARPAEGDPRARVIDPSERTRWLLSYRVQLDFSNVHVRNPDRDIYTEPQLARGQSFNMVGETEFRAIGDHPGYALENQLRLRYGLLRTVSPSGPPSGLINNVDIASARTLVFYRRLLSRTPAWYHPRPYADVYVETELTRPTDRRDYHHLQLLPTAGIRFELSRQFSLYAGGGLTWEVLARADQLRPQAAPAAAAFVAGWQLRPQKLLHLGERAIEAESNLDYLSRDWFGAHQGQLRFRVRVSVPVYTLLTFVVTYDAFMRYVPGSVGFSGDLIMGLAINNTHALQAFAF